MINDEPFEKVLDTAVENVGSSLFLSTLAPDRRVCSVPGLLVEMELVNC